MKWAQPPRLRFAPTATVSKLHKTSSCLVLTLFTFATARVSGKKHEFLEVPISRFYMV